jgi:MYXO-CTERM domain-containing protein
VTRTTAAALALVAFLYAQRSEAHFNLIMPPPADSATDGGKGAPPCGPTTASNVVTSVQGGHAITLQLDETVLHPGWYRVALSINSRSELPADPMVTVSGGNSTNAMYMTNPVFPVLADHLFNHTSGTTPIHYSMSLMLPNVTCTKCTLQVIEFMNMHGSNPGGGYFYHHCADLKITADPSMPIFEPPSPDGGVPDAGGTGGSGTGAGGRGGQGGGGTGAGGRGGATGSAGTNGTGGTTGTAGTGVTTGSAGTTGASGSTGTTGSAGTTGTAGSIGTTGAAGTTGSVGSSGSTGTTGTAGTTGASGSTGTTGAAGTTSTTGSAGTTGASSGSGGSGGGCSVAGSSAAGSALLGLTLLAGVLRRRRRTRG